MKEKIDYENIKLSVFFKKKGFRTNSQITFTLALIHTHTLAHTMFYFTRLYFMKIHASIDD